MNLCCEHIRVLRYKLRMIDIGVDMSLFVFGDNQSVISNTFLPHSKSRKRVLELLTTLLGEDLLKINGAPRTLRQIKTFQIFPLKHYLEVGKNKVCIFYSQFLIWPVVRVPYWISIDLHNP